jgi:tetratricopeptide (TPR) repeat protein
MRSIEIKALCAVVMSCIFLPAAAPGFLATRSIQQGDHAIKLAGLLGALRADGLSEKEIIKRLRERGVDFVTVPEVETELQRCGGTPALIQALREVEPERTKEVVASTYFDLGAVFYDSSRYAQAVTAYRKALGVSDNLDLAALENLSQSYNYLGLEKRDKAYYDAAVDSQKRAVAISNAPSSWSRLGFLFDEIGRYDEAIDTYKICIRLFPTYTQAYTGLAAAYRSAKRHSDGIAFIMGWIASLPDNASAYKELGVTQEQMGNAEQALESYRKATVLEPGSEDYAWYLASCYARLGRLTEAISEYKESLNLSPTYLAHLGLGEVYERLHDYTKALEAYKAAVKDKYAFVEGYLDLGKLYTKLGRPNDAIATIRAGLAEFSDFPDLYYELGLAHLASGNKRAALEAYKGLMQAISKEKQEYGPDGFEKDDKHADELLTKIKQSGARRK